jgi:hypothetical protein
MAKSAAPPPKAEKSVSKVQIPIKEPFREKPPVEKSKTVSNRQEGAAVGVTLADLRPNTISRD